ncbi:hypothetical protein [Paenibacillus xanthanilyticus]|uniref:Uncharacterized protein n=1 Tax=Paenibacillus xanthanilyticus TaxID=1783531 RepID=A0ABV8K4G9_9BACL
MYTWTKTCVSAAVAAMLLFGGASAFAAPQAPEAAKEPLMKTERFEDYADERGKAMQGEHHRHGAKRLKEAAEYFGIQTEGKTAEQLRDELRKVRQEQPEKWAKFKAEHKAKRLTMLQAEAKRLGIATEGKDLRQLHKEVREARRAECEKAKKLGKEAGKAAGQDTGAKASGRTQA